jgi:hypothetical protein
MKRSAEAVDEISDDPLYQKSDRPGITVHPHTKIAEYHISNTTTFVFHRILVQLIPDSLPSVIKDEKQIMPKQQGNRHAPDSERNERSTNIALVHLVI